jgi:anaerobic magnesium-protoporphyrin IX monomethyl ester cyclase
MRILFITNPYSVDKLGIGYLSAIAKGCGHKTFISHTKDTVYSVKIFRPDVVCYSVMTGEQNVYIASARLVKELNKNIATIFGGPYPTYFPKQMEHVDVLFRGEADLTFPIFLNELEKDYVLTWTGTKIIDHGKLIEDIDRIPMPDRDLLYNHFPENRDNPIRNVLTSRGCLFNCSHCYNSAFRVMYAPQKTLRYHSVERVIDECLEVKHNYRAKFIFFQDDEFTANKDRLSNFASLYSRRVGLNYHAQLRIDLLDGERAIMLHESGCKSVGFAIESGSEEYRKKMLHRNITNEQILRGAKLLWKHGILIKTQNMIGLPYESLSDAMHTLDINIKCKPTVAWVGLYQPFPGTELGDMCIRDGLFKVNADDIQITSFEDSVLPLPDKKKFINLHRLFGIVCNFPILRFFLPLLLAVPNNKFYHWLYATWKKRRYDTKLYPF